MKRQYHKSFFRTGISSLTALGLALIVNLSATSQTSSTQAIIPGTDVIVRINSVKDNAAPANEYDKLPDGKKFFALQVVIDNRSGKEAFDVTPSNLKLKDEEGNEYEITYSVTEQPTLKSGSLDAGDLVKGWIAFEVPSAVKGKGSRLRYESGDSKSVWIPLASLVK